MKYNKIIIATHWIIALLFALLFLSDYLRSISDKGTEIRVLWLNLHSWFGIMVFVLTIIRLAVKMNSKAPAAVYEKGVMQLLLHGAHISLYLITLLVPISGYIRFAGKGGRSLTIAGETMPSLVDKSEWLFNLGKATHGDVMESIILIVIVGHIAAALYHQLIIKDKVMSRILP
ncbi:cytochrome b/b6 domain-containing protein [Psychromonas sp. MME2]|uniref:cytochrome b n=1 Tax=unclassified Psychromonas TaxID=2614957 RepID=UPI00339BD1EA